MSRTVARLLKRWLAARAERRMHNHRDPGCRYWYGDNSDFALLNGHCHICVPTKGRKQEWLLRP